MVQTTNSDAQLPVEISVHAIEMRFPCWRVMESGHLASFPRRHLVPPLERHLVPPPERHLVLPPERHLVPPSSRHLAAATVGVWDWVHMGLWDQDHAHGECDLVPTVCRKIPSCIVHTRTLQSLAFDVENGATWVKCTNPGWGYPEMNSNATTELLEV